jgi:hypothetical protein
MKNHKSESMKEALSKDVFLGRGPNCYKNPGNKEYRSLVKLYASDFHRGLKKTEKSKFIDSLKFKLSLQGFRFFTFSDVQKKWESACELEVKEKIGHDLRDYRRPLSITKRKTLVPKGKTEGIKKRQLAFRNVRLELNTRIKRYPVLQNSFSQGGDQMMNLVHRLNSPVNYAMTSTIGFLQNPGFSYHYLVPKHIPNHPFIGNQSTNNLIPRYDNFDKEKIKAANESSVCEDSSISIQPSIPDPTLQNTVNDISEGKPSALHECGLK